MAATCKPRARTVIAARRAQLLQRDAVALRRKRAGMVFADLRETMGPAIALRLRQHLTLTPQVQQALRLLQMSAMEFAQEQNRILIELQESGFAVPSSTLLDGRFSIRCAIVNHRSTRADFDALAAEVVRLGRERS